MNLSATDSWLSQVKHVLSVGEPARNTLEIVSSRLSWDMSRPLIMDPRRKLNYRFACAEAAYIITGQNRIEFLTSVMRSFKDFSTDDGVFQPGSYGPPFVDQLPYIIDCSLADRDTRQAVISLWRPRPYKSRDIPCTLTLQFLVRNEALHCIVNMRSSDVWRGLTYDLFCFSCMSAVVAHYLDVPRLGNGYLHAGSSHLYERDKAAAVELVAGTPSQFEQSPQLVPISIEDLFDILVFAKDQVDNEDCLAILREAFSESD